MVINITVVVVVVMELCLLMMIDDRSVNTACSPKFEIIFTHTKKSNGLINKIHFYKIHRYGTIIELIGNELFAAKAKIEMG